MNRLKYIDYWLLFVVFILFLIGIIFLASVSAVFSLEKFGKTGHYFNHQIFLGFLPGILLGVILFFFPLSFIKKISFISVVFSLLLMFLVFIPGLNITSGGASRWLNLGFFSFQPSEFLKLTFIVYLSAWLSSRTKKQSKWNFQSWKFTFFPFFVILILIFLIFYFQSNASMVILFFLISISIYFISGISLSQVIALILSAGLGITSLIIFEPYRLQRVKVALGFIKDPLGLGYQINQSLITIGSGGIFGLGLGMSRQKFGNFIPQTMSDSIFAIFAEELGFLGSASLVCLFLLFFWRCFVIALRTQDKFSQLCAMGIGFWFFFQAFINIGAMTQIIPLTGVPLPFISYGGSHIAVELAAIGILLNISKQKNS